MTDDKVTSQQQSLVRRRWHSIVNVSRKGWQCFVCFFTGLSKIVSFLANVAVVGGIYFAYTQINLSVTMEKQRIAIDAVSRARSPEFLKAYRQLKSVCERMPPRATEQEKLALADPFNYVVSVYGQTERIYINNIADRCIIRDGVLSGVKEVTDKICGQCLTTTTCTPEYQTRLREFVILMENEPCPPTGSTLSTIK